MVAWVHLFCMKNDAIKKEEREKTEVTYSSTNTVDVSINKKEERKKET